MIYLISYPRSGNTMTRFLVELVTKRPTNGLCGTPNAKDNLQQPLIHKDRTDYVLNKRHDFKNVNPNDFVFFVIRDPFEATIRHNEQQRGIKKEQMYGYLDSWFALLEQFDRHDNGMALYYDALQKIASKESLAIYRHAQSDGGADFHKAKLTKEVYEELLTYVNSKYAYLYEKYLK